MVASLLLALVLFLPEPQAAQSICSNIWQQRAADFEAYLLTAKIEKIAEIPIGVTKPQRAYLEPEGLIGSFAWKPIRPGMRDGYFESYKSEVAAYELDKLLVLNMVPPVVERRVNSELGAAIMWVEGVRSWESVQPLPKPATWGFQLARMKMFDDLISNSDRNKGNLIVDNDWHIYLIDHSRAFVTDVKLPQELQNIDRKLWDRMLALDQARLEASMGKWLDTRQIASLLKRRDAMKKKIDALVKMRGDTVFF